MATVAAYTLWPMRSPIAHTCFMFLFQHDEEFQKRTAMRLKSYKREYRSDALPPISDRSPGPRVCDFADPPDSGNVVA